VLSGFSFIPKGVEMNRTLSYVPLVALAALAACSDQPTQPAAAVPQAPAAADQAGRYIVVLKEDDGMSPSFARAAVGEVTEKTQVHADRVFSHVLPGFAAQLTAAQVAALRADPTVAYVEEDAPVRLFTTQTTNLPWGLDRIDQRNRPLSLSFTYTAAGAGVNVYILDTGITLTHLNLAGRANFIPNGAGGNFVGDANPDATDCNGHGSHVAGTVAGVFSGIAKAATVWGGRVVNCSGGGNASMVIAGMDWVAANGQKPGVVNMSLGYGNVQSVADAATRLVAAGFVVAVAAGNGDFLGRPINACTEAPAKAPNVLTVGATTNTDAEASFSNYGTCVDLLAPGVNITSSYYAVDNQVTDMSGTSMASPHVAGVAAVYLSTNPTATPATVMAALTSNATSNVLTLSKKSRQNGTPNKLLFTNY
jgi:subtilisin family serine protease